MGSIRQIIKRITHPFLKRGLNRYYRKPRRYKYDQIEVMVHPDVFPPEFTLSTKILLDFISEIDLSEKSFLELGCGSGIISLYAAKKGAKVVASDINETAIAFLKTAAVNNNLPVHCLKSDLFNDISEKNFDFIIINPPYYPKQPKNVKEKAWFCGPNLEYFENLFQQLPQYLSKENTTYMILSEDCELQAIIDMAKQRNIAMDVVFQTKKLGEHNFIFQLQFR